MESTRPAEGTTTLKCEREIRMESMRPCGRCYSPEVWRRFGWRARDHAEGATALKCERWIRYGI